MDKKVAEVIGKVVSLLFEHIVIEMVEVSKSNISISYTVMLITAYFDNRRKYVSYAISQPTILESEISSDEYARYIAEQMLQNMLYQTKPRKLP